MSRQKALTINLTQEIEEGLFKISKEENISESELIKIVLKGYIDSYYQKNKKTPYEIGKKYFGVYSSGKKDISQKRKLILENILYEKNSH
ncbi:MAG: transcriptional regulator [Leptospiraceae bacterium]|nr:transcriptional regulator [Leptospiraceae bacterium]MCP5496781.1 transcriptional regulator [Leptospiraceae bacterium]